MTTSMKRPASQLVLLGALAGLTACATMRRNAAAYDGRQLTAAGFSIQPLESHDAPPMKVVEGRAADGHTVYRYTDPYHCRCEYVGDAQAYVRYQDIAEDDYVESVLSMSVK